MNSSLLFRFISRRILNRISQDIISCLFHIHFPICLYLAGQVPVIIIICRISGFHVIHPCFYRLFSFAEHGKNRLLAVCDFHIHLCMNLFLTVFRQKYDLIFPDLTFIHCSFCTHFHIFFLSQQIMLRHGMNLRHLKLLPIFHRHHIRYLSIKLYIIIRLQFINKSYHTQCKQNCHYRQYLLPHNYLLLSCILMLGNCETHNLCLLYMQIEQLLRRYYEVGTKEGPNLLGRFLSTIGI